MIFFSFFKMKFAVVSSRIFLIGTCLLIMLVSARNTDIMYTSTMTECPNSSMFTRCRRVQAESIKNERIDPSARLKQTRFIVSHLVCPSEFDARTLAELDRFESQCRTSNVTAANIEYFTWFNLVVEATPRLSVINESIGVFRYNEKHIDWNFYVFLIDFRGFDIRSSILLNYSLVTEIVFDKRGLNLYANDRLLRNCEDDDNESMKFIFQINHKYPNSLNLTLHRAGSKYPVCSLFFRNALIDQLKFLYLINSFYLKSIVTFCDAKNQSRGVLPLNSTILDLQIEKIYAIDVDSRLLNPRVFARVQSISFLGHVSLIQVGVFAPFRQLRLVTFEAYCLIRVIRKQGIGWIKAINSHLNVNLTNQTDVDSHLEFSFRIKCKGNREFWSENTNHYFYDKDFCLFADFPFHQMVFLQPSQQDRLDVYRKTTRSTCVELWLFKFSDQIEAANSSACFFQQRIRLCRQKSQFQITQTRVTNLDLVLIFEFVLIILSPSLSVFGIVTNLLTISIIFHKNNEKTMQEKHYLYMNMYCASNLMIFSTQLIGLVSECQVPFGFFCSSIHRRVFTQYVKIIVVDYLNAVCRLFSNFAYFGFAVCRLARIGKDHGKLIVFINELGIRKLAGVSLVMSGGLAVSKSLQNRINYFETTINIYPHLIFQFVIDWQNHASYVVLFVFNFLFNLLNNFLFVFVHLTIDLVLIKKLIRVLREKEEKMSEMKRGDKEIEELSKENEESKRRAVFMVVLNSTLNFLTRLPLMLTSVNDLRLLVRKPYRQVEDSNYLNSLDEFNPWFTFKFYCSSVKSCLVFQSFGNCLFLFSLSTVIFFLKNFDKNFMKAYQTFFAWNSSSENNQDKRN